MEERLQLLRNLNMMYVLNRNQIRVINNNKNENEKERKPNDP